MTNTYESQQQMEFAAVTTAYGVGRCDPEVVMETGLEAIPNEDRDRVVFKKRWENQHEIDFRNKTLTWRARTPRNPGKTGQ